MSAALEVRDLTLAYGRGAPVVDRFGLTLERGQVIGLVGESGSGKSTIARTLVGALRPVAGSVCVEGADLAQARGRRLRALRRRIQLVPQDPQASLNPRMSVAAAIAEGCPRGASRAERAREVERLLEAVALTAAVRTRRPHELSGGQRQRVALARALAVAPAVLVADEITSALDCSVQAGILNLLAELRERLDLAIVFISHDLAVVGHLCDAVVVLQAGRVVEEGSAEAVLAAPREPYTRLLLESAPTL